MRIRFETTIDDVVAFNRFHFANSPAYQRQVWMVVLLVPAILGILFLLLLMRDEPFIDFGLANWAIALVFIVISVMWGMYVRVLMSWSLEHNTWKFLSEGSNRAMFGWREMELVNGRLVFDSEWIHTRMDLRTIERIVGNEKYTFVYISSMQAYLIPMNLYPEHEYHEFVAELRQAWENRDAPRQNEPRDAPVRQPDERIVERPY